MADKEKLGIIAEVVNDNIKTVISEATDDSPKKYYLRGEFSRASEPNKNKRVYSRAVLESAITDNAGILESRRMMGELDHPPTPKINLEKVSHVITKLELDENGIMTGEAEVLDTPNGKILKSLMESGVQLGISSRGYGKVLRKGDLMEVAPGYKMITFDIVADPSSQKAFPEPVYEDVELIDEDATTVKDILSECFKTEEN